ncbi:MAG: hypothetical protein EHM42_02570 [Planctomycetaceae bacterium]|nr:MAG: hypothetical protein EHM42_02570 [Planctomycetaceae bacterium]
MPSQHLPVVDSRRCTLCGDCLSCCPANCLRLVRLTDIVVIPQACVGCAVCANICPTSAIAMQTLDW